MKGVSIANQTFRGVFTSSEGKRRTRSAMHYTTRQARYVDLVE